MKKVLGLDLQGKDQNWEEVVYKNLVHDENRLRYAKRMLSLVAKFILLNKDEPDFDESLIEKYREQKQNAINSYLFDDDDNCFYDI